MANGNPFYIDPTGGIDTSAGIRGLASSVAGFGELQRQRKQEEQQAEAKRLLDERMKSGQAALQGAIGDPAKMAQVMIDYPELQKTAESVFQFTNDATKPIVTQTYSQVLSNPDNAVEYLTRGIEQVRAAGGNPQNMIADLQAFQTNPEQAFKQVELGVATVSPETYQAYQSQKPKPVKPVELQYKEGGVIFNPRTGETRLASVRPEGKKPKLKEVKNGVKYYEDGSEEAIGTGETVKNPVTGKTMSPEQADSALSEAKEFQLKNGGFAMTLADGLGTIDRMYAQGYDPTKAAWIEAALGGGTVGNLLRSGDDQMFVGATDQMINAIARRETGAAITEFERKDFFRRYMPTPGDSKKRLQQKRDALERQLKSIAGQSGGVFEALTIQGQEEPISQTGYNVPSSISQETQPVDLSTGNFGSLWGD